MESIFAFIPLELKILIASFANDGNIPFNCSFYKLTIIDNEFREYSKTDRGNRLFIDLFTNTIKQYSDFVNGEFYEKTYLFGNIHSIFDKPAIVYYDKLIYDDSNEHQLSKFIKVEGTKLWYKNGKCHREGDLPAYIGADGSQEWYKNGLCHRDDNKPAIQSSQYIEYYNYGEKYNPPYSLHCSIKYVIPPYLYIIAAMSLYIVYNTIKVILNT
jgi:hypothetical protein